MKILIAGYPYVRENFLRTFDSITDRCIFLLPKKWKAKGGKVVFTPPVRKNVKTTTALFFHSHYPIIGGVLKGWMPSFPLWLWKYRKVVNIVYSPLEPILLSTLYQGFWSKLMGKKHIIFTWENVPYSKFKGINGLIKNIILKANILFCDGFICGNQKAKGVLSRYTNLPMEVIPLSGLDTNFFSPDKRDMSLREGYHLEGKFIFSFIGAIDYRKGIHIILDALKGIIADNKNVYLIIAGSGEYELEIKNKISELGLEDKITIIPWVDSSAVRKILSVTDVFLYPSISHKGWEEQFGYSIAEAMSMAVPVISTNSGSISDLIEGDKSGMLIESGSIPALEHCMRLLMSDDSLRNNLTQAARRVIMEKYSLESVARQYYKFFSYYGF